MTVTVTAPVPVYGSQSGYPNEGIFLMPGEIATVINPKVPAVFGPRPYFMLVEFERNGQAYRAALWSKSEYQIVLD